MRSEHLLPALSACVMVAAFSGAAQAAPVLRYQVDQHGDFVLFGNVLGFECDRTGGGTPVPAPVVGTADCTAVGNANANDSSPDILWRSDDPAAGEATANDTITVDQARSTAVLQLPAGATISYARLYWAGFFQDPGATADLTVQLESPGAALNAAITADGSFVATRNGAWYQSTADVTALVSGAGAGAFRVSGISTEVVGLNNNDPIAAWSMVVFYELASEPPRNLALFDGLDLVENGADQTVAINGFLVPAAGFDAKLGVIAYEGEENLPGDAMEFNGVAQSNALNPADNFFNGTRSFLGNPVSVAGDLPQLTGEPRSLAGMDLDVVDVSAQLASGDTSATITATSNQDTYLLGAFITSISTFRPDFTTSGKTLVDLNGGTIRPGDELAYTVTATNTGNDASINTVLTDPLPVGVTYVPGSLQIVSGPGAGALTDAAGDDPGEYAAGARTVTVRLGTGADATQGGTLEVGETTVISFHVTVDADAVGSIDNQATISAEGQQGAPPSDYPTDGNGAGPGTPPTTGNVDECTTDADCAAPAPLCDVYASPHICVGCVTGADCTVAHPDCNPTSHVCYCFDGNDCTDTDHDGLTDEAEIALGTDPHDADSDDDGVPDGSEIDPGADSDGDGLINALDPDSDNDGLFDGTELGLDCSSPATDPAAHACRADADQGATTTNPLLADTDGGGASDGSEDANLDGMVDPGETDPTAGHPQDDATVVDTDGDGLGDALEGFLGSDPNDADTDDDGVPDGLEPNPSHDTDHDGLINVLDVDSDDDGLFDGTEMGRDCSNPATDAAAGHCRADGDAGATTTSPLLRDTDRGGVTDGSEDFDLDGVLDPGETDPTAGHGADDATATDTDGDGLSDGLEDTLGTNPNDADSDDDGVPDGLEPNPSDDTDGDGLINALDPDSDGDGLFDGTEMGFGCSDAATDTSQHHCTPDGDAGATTTNPLDPDTDRGGVPDGTEDANHNGVVDPGETDPNDPSDDHLGEACTTDAQCGGPQSGAVCNTAHVCARGCRGTGGNACPADQECTSHDATVGNCVTPGTGGAGGAGGATGSGGAGATAGAPAEPTGTLEGGGCACSTPGRGSDGLGALALGALVWLGRRRRR